MAELTNQCCTPAAQQTCCGVPTAVADLHEGEIVLDLGSGAGADRRKRRCRDLQLRDQPLR